MHDWMDMYMYMYTYILYMYMYMYTYRYTGVLTGLCALSVDFSPLASFDTSPGVSNFFSPVFNL